MTATSRYTAVSNPQTVAATELRSITSFAANTVLVSSFTNDSLYTSFQPARCFFASIGNNVFCTIDRKYGLDKMAAYESPGAYWEAQASHLLRQIEVYASYTAARGPFQPMNILVAGEAAEAADFRDVVQAVAGQIPGLLHRQDRFWHLQVVFSGDPAFAAARGAAVWRGMELDETYCDEFYESGELSDPYAEEEKHVEL